MTMVHWQNELPGETFYAQETHPVEDSSTFDELVLFLVLPFSFPGQEKAFTLNLLILSKGFQSTLGWKSSSQ